MEKGESRMNAAMVNRAGKRQIQDLIILVRIGIVVGSPALPENIILNRIKIIFFTINNNGR